MAIDSNNATRLVATEIITMSGSEISASCRAIKKSATQMTKELTAT